MSNLVYADLTSGQQRAHDVLLRYYGQVKITDGQVPNTIRLLAWRAGTRNAGVDGHEACRWIVQSNGVVVGAWDPDRVLGRLDRWPHVGRTPDDPQTA